MKNSESECLKLENKEKDDEFNAVGHRLRELSCSVPTTSVNIEPFDGKNMKSDEFLRQFEPPWREWGSRNTDDCRK